MSGSPKNGIRDQGFTERAAQFINKSGGISESYLRQFMFFISQMGFKTEEPGDFDYMGQEESYRFNQLLLHALAEEHISMSKAAALSNMKLAEFREKNLMPG